MATLRISNRGPSQSVSQGGRDRSRAAAEGLPYKMDGRDLWLRRRSRGDGCGRSGNHLDFRIQFLLPPDNGKFTFIQAAQLL